MPQLVSNLNEGRYSEACPYSLSKNLNKDSRLCGGYRWGIVVKNNSAKKGRLEFSLLPSLYHFLKQECNLCGLGRGIIQ